jgi:carboxyl-terminal processing protease
MDLRSRLSGLVFTFFVLLLGVFSGIVIDRQLLLFIVPTAQMRPGDESRFTLINEAWNLIEDHYVAYDDIEPNILVYGAVSGMVEALGDEGHSRFLTPEMLESEQIHIQAEFEGIGATVEYRNDQAVIVAPFDGSPAQKAGVKPGDVVLAVDGEEMAGKDLSEVVSLIKGPAGTDVTITLLDPETGEVRDVTITRAVITIQNVRWARVPGTDIGVVRIAAFSDGVTDDLREALEEMEAQGIKGVILDLRNNSGGLRDEAIGVTSEFLGEGNVLLQQNADGDIREFKVDSGGLATDIPMAVLVNEGSASASEITAGAIQDYERAPVVGQTTFGTGTVLQTFPMSDGSAILLATSQWLTPDGRVIWHQGLVPDHIVDLPDEATLVTPELMRDMTQADLEASMDEQLFKAIELVLEMIGG